MRRIVSAFIGAALSAGALVLQAPPVHAFSNCTGVHLHQIGISTAGVTQPPNTQFEGISTTPLTWHSGAPCIGHGSSNASDGGTNTAWIMLQGGGSLAQIGIGYDPSPAWDCFRSFYYVVDPYENVTVFGSAACIADGFTVNLTIKTVSSPCPLYSPCTQLYFGNSLAYTTKDSPRAHWGTLAVEVAAEINDDWSDVPDACILGESCGSATVASPDANDFNRLKVQKYDGVFYHTCYGNANFRMVADGSTGPLPDIHTSRFAANFVPYGCNPVVGANHFRSWTYA